MRVAWPSRTLHPTTEKDPPCLTRPHTPDVGPTVSESGEPAWRANQSNIRRMGTTFSFPKGVGEQGLVPIWMRIERNHIDISNPQLPAH